LSSWGDRIDTDEGSVITAICKILGVFVGQRRVATTTTTTTMTTTKTEEDDGGGRRRRRTTTTPLISAPSVVAHLS
jgi:hypothetical protein